jgi:hypothetical protein
VISKCGYPAVQVRVPNYLKVQDFDIAYASFNNILPEEDLEGWVFNTTSNWFGSFATGSSNSLDLVSEGIDAEPIKEADWYACNTTLRNLYVTITRRQVTPDPTSSGEFLSRQLLGNGTFTNDLELGFTAIRGSKMPEDFANYIKVAAFALVAVLSVFVF